MNTILSEYFTLATSVKNKKDLKYCLFQQHFPYGQYLLTVWLLLKKTFTVTLVAKLNRQSRKLTLVKSDSGL